MAKSIENVNNCIKILLGNLKFKTDYQRYEGKKPRVLLVEGSTDEKFINKMKSNDITLLVGNKAFRENKMQPSITNYKQAIVETVYGLSRVPQLLSCPGSEEWKVYGMVDLDFSKSSEYGTMPMLFVTDTHDLETLLLSTDKELLGKLGKCVIQISDIKKAYSISYQIGLMRKVIRETSKDLSDRPLSAEDVDYSCMMDDYKISIYDLAKYINRKMEQPLSEAKVKKIVSNCMKDKAIKKLFDAEGRWKMSWEEFEPDKFSNFWDMINGHDILAVLRYLNQDVYEAYANKNNTKLNREFEMDLIEHYEYENIKETEIYSAMKLAEVVE